MDVEAGDTLLLLTDGLAEAVGPAGESFGYERVRESFAREARAALDGGLPVDRIPERLWSEVVAWAGTERPEDDVTVLAIRAR